MEVLQTSALPLGYGAGLDGSLGTSPHLPDCVIDNSVRRGEGAGSSKGEDGAGNGIRTRDFDLGKVALYH